MSTVATLFAAATTALAAAPDVTAFTERAPDGYDYAATPAVVVAQPDAFEGLGSDRDGDARAVLAVARCYGPLADAVRLSERVADLWLALDAAGLARAEFVRNVAIPNRDPSVRYAGREVAVRLTCF